MVTFDPDQTEMIFFDLEFYVPKEERDKPGASLLANPCKEGQFLLGGVFARWRPLKESNKNLRFTHYWIWKQRDEKKVLDSIYRYFQESWLKLKDKDPRQADLILCGVGISRFDVPILYIRSVHNQIDLPENIFECYFKTKQVDLSNVAIACFNRTIVMYPKTINQIFSRFGIKKGKTTGMSVWDMYDDEDFDGIEKRTESEVRDSIKLYNVLGNKIFRTNR